MQTICKHLNIVILFSSLRLYWVDAFFDKIEHSTFDGLDRKSLERISQMTHPFGLTIFGGECGMKEHVHGFSAVVRFLTV